MDILIYIALIFGAILFMEFVAWFAHKYLMHGALWSWHADHHDPKLHDGFFEKNDRFFLVFAIPSAACYILGLSIQMLFPLLFIGIGISIYGVIYFLIHDVYIHRRFKWFKHLDNPYSRAILRAHGSHHSIKDKEGATSFGLLIIHPKYFSKTRIKK